MLKIIFNLSNRVCYKRSLVYIRWWVDFRKEFAILGTRKKLSSIRKQKIYIALVIIFLGGVFELIPSVVVTIIPIIFFTWETVELFFNKNAINGYKKWIKNKKKINKNH